MLLRYRIDPQDLNADEQSKAISYIEPRVETNLVKETLFDVPSAVIGISHCLSMFDLSALFVFIASNQIIHSHAKHPGHSGHAGYRWAVFVPLIDAVLRDHSKPFQLCY